MRIALLLALLSASPAFSADDQFNGRWDIQPATRGRAWWLEITGAGTPALRGKFVGAPGGQMDDIPELSIQNGELRFVFEREWRFGEKRQRMRGVWTARLVDGKLKGQFNAGGRPPVEWTGVRAPVITEKDDGSWREGKPVELFNGKDLSGWVSLTPGRETGWLVKDGLLTNQAPAPNLASEQKFWNFKLHVEYRVEARSNSGMGLRGRYEVQILEDHGRPVTSHSNGGLYSRILPAVNASKPAGEWQTFDIRLVGRMVTVALNGTKIIDNREIEGLTAVATDPSEAEPGPITLQGDHGVVEFRKITLTPLLR
ncbi:MAG: DUF1080 domain-containing protein [Acidobacteriota bacterium]